MRLERGPARPSDGCVDGEHRLFLCKVPARETGVGSGAWFRGAEGALDTAL